MSAIPNPGVGDATPAASVQRRPQQRAWAWATASVVGAAAAGFALARGFGPVQPWLVAVAAALGGLGGAVPLLVAQRRRVPAAEPDTVPMHAEPAPATATGTSMSRPQFMDLVGREWARSRRYGTGAALLLIEIDRYSRLTAALGPAAGEEVLAALQSQIVPTLRGADAVARHDAGQIAVFLAHADAMGALDVAERVRERAEHFEVPVPPKRVRFTVSVGVAHLRPAHLHLQSLMSDVGEAVLAARTVGGNCVRAAPIEASLLPQRPGTPPRNDLRARKD